MRVLGIETSCDETSAAVVDDGPRLLGQIVLSQARLHERYGGVVPEIACRSHVENLTTVIERTLAAANLRPGDLDAIAVAHRPGLIGALLVGVCTAKALAWAWNLPLLAVDHLEAHLEAPRITGRTQGVAVAPPFLGVVLSGGHTDLYRVEDGARVCIGATQDDAVGEAFDKVATVLGLGYPGGPRIEREALAGDPNAVPLPRSLLGRDSLDFSFSGLKTAVLYAWRGPKALSAGPVDGAPSRPDLAASFQAAVGDVLVAKVKRALAHTGLRTVVFGGGVTANRYLRERLERELAADADLVVFPAPEFSTDNGAMIAAMGQRLLREGRVANFYLDAEPTS
ncbi:MAG: tRNA (adenosine(37)-N6)-threonylcarbamoyltransferase complex transferase subunit TsaD [Planctomycetota bacterium]